MIVSNLKQSMAAVSLPWGLIALNQRQLDFANPALQSYLRQHLLPPKLPLGALEPLMLAFQQCLDSRQESTARLPGSPGLWHFNPVIEQSVVVAVQCFVLNDEPAVRKLPPSGLGHTDHFEAFLDHLPYQVWIATPHGELTWLNRALTLYAYNHTQHLDLSEGIWIDLVHPDDLVTVNAGLSRALITDQPTGYRLRLKNHQGVYHWCFATLAPVKNAQGQTLYWVGSNINIDTVKQSEDQFREEILRLRNALQQSQEELDQTHNHLARLQKLDMVSKLSAGVAHDLNNLLFITGLHAGLLEKKLQEPAQREHVEVIHDTIRKAGRLASQLTGFSSRKAMELSQADPAKLVRDMELLLNKAVGNEVELQICLAASLWPVNVDRMYFENSLINLCINARDAISGKGCVTLTAENVVLRRSEQDEACETRGGDYVLISVADDGAGMDESVLARVFEMFFTTKPEGKGAGLGLPMVKNFMNHSGGLLEVESTPGKGSCFKLYFPRADMQMHSEPARQILAQGAQETVLLIEGELELRNTMAEVLYELGYQVATAYRPEVALRYINSGLKVDLIIATTRMPGQLSAIEMHRQIMAEGLSIPMLLTTGQSSEQLTQLADGQYTLLYKPVSMPDLAQAVRDLLQPAHAQQA